MVNEIQEFKEQMDEISNNLQSSPGYRAAKIFHCSYCDTTGKVAIHVKCTECGEKTGWAGGRIKNKGI